MKLSHAVVNVYSHTVGGEVVCLPVDHVFRGARLEHDDILCDGYNSTMITMISQNMC